VKTTADNIPPTLPRSYKGQYPFRLAATSFIYPADYVTNVRRLGPHLDEIELLLFESRPDALPTAAEIDRLAALAAELALTYNVHLPLDISICSPDAKHRLAAVRTLKQIIDLTAPLSPTTHTLHLPYESGPRTAWLEAAEQSIARLLDLGIRNRCLSIETLDYPFEWVSDIVETHNLSVCIDLGHLILHGMDPVATLDRHHERTAIIHFHGVTGTADHLPLERLDITIARPLVDRLKRFAGTVSIEVFSFDDLAASLETLAAWWSRS